MQYFDSPRLSEVAIDSEPIGKGNFGAVYKGNWNGTDVAIKVLSSNNGSELKTELALLRKVHHPNVVGVYGLVDVPKKQGGGGLGLVLEYCPLGSLDVLIQQPFRIPELLRMANDIANGLNALHSHNILHLDLALRNVLVTAKFSPYRICCKLSDLGLSRQLVGSNKVCIPNSALATRWTAPELLAEGFEFGMKAKHATMKSDIFSFGIVLVELFSKAAAPYSDLTDLEQVRLAVVEGQRPNQPKLMPDDVFRLAQRCWSPRPRERPRADQVLECLAHFLTDTPSASEEKSSVASGSQETSSTQTPQVSVRSDLRFEVEKLGRFFYRGALTRAAAEESLSEAQIGTWVLRDSSLSGQFAVTFRARSVVPKFTHTLLTPTAEGNVQVGQKGFPDFAEAAKYITNSCAGLVQVQIAALQGVKGNIFCKVCLGGDGGKGEVAITQTKMNCNVPDFKDHWFAYPEEEFAEHRRNGDYISIQVFRQRLKVKVPLEQALHAVQLVGTVICPLDRLQETNWVPLTRRDKPQGAKILLVTKAPRLQKSYHERLPQMEPGVAVQRQSKLETDQMKNEQQTPPAPAMGGLPPGWDFSTTATGEVYFIDHNNKSTTFVDPRVDLPKSPSETDPKDLSVFVHNSLSATPSSASLPTTGRDFGPPDEPANYLRELETKVLPQCTRAIADLSRTWLFKRNPRQLVLTTENGRSEANMLMRIASRGAAIDITDCSEPSAPYLILLQWVSLRARIEPKAALLQDLAPVDVVAIDRLGITEAREAYARVLGVIDIERVQAAGSVVDAMIELVGVGALTLQEAVKNFTPVLLGLGVGQTPPSDAVKCLVRHGQPRAFLESMHSENGFIPNEVVDSEATTSGPACATSQSSSRSNDASSSESTHDTSDSGESTSSGIDIRFVPRKN